MSRRSALLPVLAAIAVIGVLLPGTALGLSSKSSPLAPGAQSGFEDVDARVGSVAPTADQRAIASSLGAQATWNEFGTPGSLVRYGGFLATGLQAPDPVAAARKWVEANEALFRLQSADGLEVISDARLSGSDGYALVFSQRFGGLQVAEGGLLTIGITGTPTSGWKVAYASSSLTGDTGLAAQPNLSPTEAWARAAANVGRTASGIGNVKADRGWSVFSAEGFSELQRARLVAVPTPQDGVRPAYETLVLDNQDDHWTAYQQVIDAQNGSLLIRKDLVEHSHPPTADFTGELGAADGACQINGSWTVDSDEEVESIVVSVEATLTTNDVVIDLLRNGTVVAHQDTLFSPEVLVYDPPDAGVGTYEVRVCDFVDTFGWDEPRTYSGQIIFNGAAGTDTASPYPPMWKVFPGYPRIGNETFAWNYPNTDIRKLWCWESTVGFPPQPVIGPGGEACAEEVQNLASRFPWDVNPRTGTPTFTTSGNNAQSAEAWTSPLTPGPPSQRPFAPDRRYVFPWTNAWHKNQPVATAPPGCSESNIVPGGNDIDAAVTNLFAMHNRMHDWSYFLGFTERRLQPERY
jgi:extracellular elastinolytic metalloproteinase